MPVTPIRLRGFHLPSVPLPSDSSNHQQELSIPYSDSPAAKTMNRIHHFLNHRFVDDEEYREHVPCGQGRERVSVARKGCMPLTQITSISRMAALTALVLALSVSGCKSAPKLDDNGLNTAVQQKLTSDTAI